MGSATPNWISLAQKNAESIRRIVRAHKFDDPKVVDYEDPKYAVTLLITPVGQPSLLDMAGIMNDLEDELHIKAFVVTPDSFEATATAAGSRPKVFSL
ncbi:hypothetical protein PQQ87_08440 [Paraburkholderia nemoris]|uniref:hypothetical protein n=1 Tax=Paraburkholderia nemoris TaxID=2793076 RepID=UPI0038BD4009